jgi:acetyl esterase/lipase
LSTTLLSAATAAEGSEPVGYLVGVAVTGAMTLIALTGPAVRGPLGAITYRIGLSVNELPIIFLSMLLASTLLAYDQGDPGSPVSWIALAGAGAAIAGLAVVVRRGLLAGPVVAAAVDDSLGRGSREPPRTERTARRVLRYGRMLLWPFPIRPRTVVRLPNLAYGEAGRRNLLDVYHHRDRPAGAPVLVYLHGGGYFSGHKRHEGLPLLHRLASLGWVCISANYRLRPAATFPDHLVDAKKVIAWARANASRFGADPAVVFAAGSSAGGHMVTLAALTPNDPALQPGFESADTSLTAVISLYGYYGRYYGRNEKEDIASTPFALSAAQAPPMFLVHGDRDVYVSVDAARELADRLRSRSPNPVVYAELPGGHHAFDLFCSPRMTAVVDGIERFTSWVRTRA